MQIFDSRGDPVALTDLIARFFDGPTLWLVSCAAVAYVVGVLVLGNRSDGGLFHGDWDGDCGGDGD